MRDPDEGLTPDGLIRTGARRDRVPGAFEPVLRAAIAAVGASGPAAALYVYGSVATGQAEVGRSDVDLVSIGLPAEAAAAIGADLSERFADVCREVAIGAAQPDDHRGDSDEQYGNRVFLRHYCVPLLGGPGEAHAYPGDARAARGFNGDLGTALDGWRGGGAAPRSVARKTLFAVTGLVSVHDRTWTTDRASAATRWAELHPALADDLTALSTAAEDGNGDLTRWLAPGGVVEAVVMQFRDAIGLWDALTP